MGRYMNRDELIRLLRFAENENDLNERKQELLALIPSLSVMIGYCQNNRYHQYDLWTHTLKVICYLPADLEDDMVYLAALFHDIGKPVSCCKGKREDDRQSHFYGHPEMSAQITESMVIPEMKKSGLNLTDDECERLVFYVRHHDDVMPDRQSRIEKYRKMVTDMMFHDWMELEVADAKAHVIYPKVLKRIAVCERLAAISQNKGE